MAIDEDYVDIVNERISNYITQRMKDISENLEDEIGDAFVKKARNTLINRATPDDSNSYWRVENLANSIVVRRNEFGYKEIYIEDDTGLSVYLEYGTGLIGERNSGRFTPVNWKYAVNRDKYKTFRFASGDSKRGFIFNYIDATYIDENDIYPYPIYNKKTKKRDKFNYNIVFSEGLKPIRYIYDTRVNLNRIIRSQLNKNNGLSSLREKLKEIANE